MSRLQNWPAILALIVIAIVAPLVYVQAQSPGIQVQSFVPAIGITNVNATTTPTYVFSQLFGTMTDSAAAGTFTTPTAAAICAGLGGPLSAAGQPGFGWYWDVKDTGAGTRTIAGGTGVTVSGTATIATVNVRQYKFVVVNCTVGAEAITVQSLNTSAF